MRSSSASCCSLRVLLLLLQLLQVRLAVGEPLLATRQLGQLRVDLLLLGEHALLDLDDARAMLGDLLVDLGAQPDRLLARADLGLAAERVRLARGVLEHELALLLGRAEPRLAERADGDGDGGSADDQSDQNPDCDQHGSSWVGWPRCCRGARPGGRPAWTSRNRLKRAASAAREAVG